MPKCRQGSVQLGSSTDRRTARFFRDITAHLGLAEGVLVSYRPAGPRRSISLAGSHVMSALSKSRTSLPDAGAQSRVLWILMLLALLAAAAGCSNSAKAIAAAPPLQVEVADVEQRDVPLYKESIGTLDGLVNADIKAEVSGYLTQQAYIEGTFVKKGSLLFQIDPRPFQAALDQRYRGGVDTQLNALDADRDLFNAQLALAQLRLQEILSVVQLYKALGGGWQ
jgi:multidrug efflux pump subunit AcrA (membrane-fusion protein)